MMKIDKNSENNKGTVKISFGKKNFGIIIFINKLLSG